MLWWRCVEGRRVFLCGEAREESVEEEEEEERSSGEMVLYFL